MLKYNGSILKVNNGHSVIGSVTIVTSLRCTLTGSSTIPVTYVINSSGVSETVVVNSDQSVVRELNGGDTITITASCSTGKTFSLKGLSNFSIDSCQWNHKNEGSSVSFTGTVSSSGETEIGYDDYRDKEFTAKCEWVPSDGGAWDYQPGSFVTELSTNCLKSGNWTGDQYVDDIADFTSKSTQTGNWQGGEGGSGWTQYYGNYTGTHYNAGSVFNWDQVLAWSVSYDIEVLNSPTGSMVYVIWGTHKNGGSSRMLRGETTINNVTAGTKITGTFTGSGASNKGPVNAVEFRNTNWNHGTPVNHHGYCIITGVKR